VPTTVAYGDSEQFHIDRRIKTTLPVEFHGEGRLSKHREGPRLHYPVSHPPAVPPTPTQSPQNAAGKNRQDRRNPAPLEGRGTFTGNGPAACAIEDGMNKQNNDLVLAASLASIATSVCLYASGRKEIGIFVGLWAPTFLSLGSFLNGAGSAASDAAAATADPTEVAAPIATPAPALYVTS